MGTTASKSPQAARLAASVFARALTLALALASASYAPGAPPPQRAAPAIPPFGANDAGGFRNVLPPGEAGTDNAVQFAQFNATGEYPPHAVPEPADVPADRFGQAQPVLKRTRWTSHMSARRFVRSVDETTKGDVMNDTSPAEIFDEASNWIVGGGIVTMALFPLALPGIILTVAAAIPLAAVVLAVALVAGAVIAPVLLVRALGRRVIGLWRPERTASEPVRLSAAEGCG